MALTFDTDETRTEFGRRVDITLGGMVVYSRHYDKYSHIDNVKGHCESEFTSALSAVLSNYENEVRASYDS